MTKYLRFATYTLLVVALWLPGRLVSVIPVPLDSPKSIAADAAQVANKTITDGADIFDCTRSGKEILAIGERTLLENRLQGLCAWIPRVKLQLVENRLSWVLSYDWPDAPPGSPSVLHIIVDDVTGKATIQGVSGTNKSAGLTTSAVELSGAPVAAARHR